MYFWKCWRDYRVAFFVFLSLIGLWGLVAFAILADVGGWISRREFPEVWYASAKSLLVGQVGFVYLAAFALGGSSIGDEHTKGTMPFVMTRPRSRTYLASISWLAGALALTLLALISQTVLRLGFGISTPMRNQADFLSWRLLAMTILMPLLFYALTFFFTLAFRSGKNGTGAALLLVISYVVISVWLSVMADIRLPYSPGRGDGWWANYPVQEFLVLLALSAGLALAANQVFARQEA